MAKCERCGQEGGQYEYPGAETAVHDGKMRCIDALQQVLPTEDDWGAMFEAGRVAGVDATMDGRPHDPCVAAFRRALEATQNVGTSAQVQTLRKEATKEGE